MRGRDALIKYRFRVFAVIRRILQLVAVIDYMRDRSLQLQYHLQLHLFVALVVDDDMKPLDAQRQPICNRQFPNDILLMWHDLCTNARTHTHSHTFFSFLFSSLNKILFFFTMMYNITYTFWIK